MFLQTSSVRPSRQILNQRNLRRLDNSLSILSRDWWKDRTGPDTSKLKDAFSRACSVEVTIRGRVYDLGQLARQRPTELERLMDSTDPNHKDYWAIVLVYNKYEKRIVQRCVKRSALIQEKTVESLQNRR